MRQLLLFVLLIFVTHTTYCQALTPIRVQLKWDHQFQFAGFYAAIAQGYYKEAGYEVSLSPRINDDGSFKNTFAELKSGRVEFAVGGPNVLTLLDSGEDIVVVSSFYQRSPYGYVSLAEHGLTSIVDIHDSCISSSHDFGELELKTVFRNEGLSLASLEIQDYQFALSSLVSGRCRVVIDYKISAMWAAREKNIDINIIEAGDYGIHFYGDTLYTLKSLVKKNPSMVEAFRQATNRGWQYALENPQEISRYIVENYSRVLRYQDPYQYNIFSAKQIKEIMNYPVTEVGHSNPYRWQKINDYLLDLGVIENQKLPDGFIFDYSSILEADQANRYRNAIVIGVVLLLVVVILAYQQYKKTVREKEFLRERQSLLEGSDLLRGVLDLIPVGVYWKDDRLRFLGGNKRFLEDSGMASLVNVVGKTDFEMPWHEDAERIQEKDSRVLKGIENSEPFEEKLLGANGEVYWLKSRKMPLKDSMDQVIGVLGTYQDITDYKSMIAELNSKNIQINNNNQQLSILIDSSPDVIVYRAYKDNELNVSVFNHMFQKWVGGEFPEKIPAGALAVLEENDDAVIREMDRVSYQSETLFADGRKVFLDVVKVPVLDAGNNIVGILFTARDVTETRELQSLYEALFSLTQDPFFVIDEMGAVSSCNDSAAKILGLDNRKNLIGMRLIQHFTPERQPNGERSSDVVARVNEEVTVSPLARIKFDFTHQDIDGNELRVRVFIVRLDGGPKKRLLVQWHDINDMFAREEALRQAKVDAEEMANEKSMFLANMSHEIRTPLNALVGLSHLLNNNQNHAKQQDYIESINKASVHLKSIVDDILDYSKIEANHIFLDEISVDISLLLSEVISLHKQSALEKGLDLHVDNRLPENCLLQLDPVRYRQIINNLLSNAIKFTKEGAILLSIEQQNSDLVLSVADSGCGMTQKQIDVLFAPFSQADVTTTRKYGGTGLGLSICKGLIELMRGTISVKSSPEKGTCFIVTSPIKFAENKVAANDALSIPDFTGKHFLVVEDNAINQMVIEGLLEETYCQLSFAGNGQEALKMIEGDINRFDAIFMDLQMPVMDGYQATETLKKIADFTTPIIALTANANDSDKERCYAAGMQGFVAKPVDQTQLYDVIRKVIG